MLLQLPNTAAYVVTLLALMRVGAIPTLLLPAHREAEVAALCESYTQLLISVAATISVLTP